MHSTTFACNVLTPRQPAPDRKAFFAVPKENLTADLSGDECRSANAVLVCRVPLHAQAGPEWSVGAWKEVDKVHERLTFKSLAWLTERVRNDDDFKDWQEVASNGAHEDCTRCAPRAPAIRWAKNEKKKRCLLSAMSRSTKTRMLAGQLGRRWWELVVCQCWRRDGLACSCSFPCDSET